MRLCDFGRALTLALATAFLISGSAARARADARAALPAAVGGFKETKPPATFSPATLENLIDGGAEAVKFYAFQQCAYAEYAPGGKGNQLITAEVYQFAQPLDAFGYYSSQRNSDAQIVKIGGDGYQEASDLNFWKGAYCVKITITTTPTPAYQQEMPKLAQAIAAKLSGPTAVPAMVGMLPPGRTPRSEQYVKINVAAQSCLKNGVLAKYKAAGPQAELFICAYGTPAQAKQAYQQYSAYLTRPNLLAAGAKPSVVKGLGDSAIAVRTRLSGNAVLALKGKDVIAMRRAKDPVAAQAIVKQAVARAK
jgi:hypothetical protein